MAETDEALPAPVMTSEEATEYRTELRKELADLEFAQYLFPTEYKADRIKRLEGRLGIEH